MSGRVAPDPVLSEVVRRRLEALLAEVPARRAIGPPGQVSAAPEPAVEEPEPPSPGPGADAPVVVGWASLARESSRRALAFTRAHLVAVGIVLLTGCLWAGYQVVQARSTPIVAAPATTAAAAATPSASVAVPEPSPSPARILVHVIGEVERPGVVTLVEGARVTDAITAAGGLTGKADTGDLNLAAVVADGSQVVVGSRTEPGGEVRGGSGEQGAPVGAEAATVSLNTATEAELDTLPGVGPVTAARIVAWREEHGRFSRIEELQEVDGIGPKTMADLAPHVTL